MKPFITGTLAGVVYVFVLLAVLPWMYRLIQWNFDLVKQVWP